MQWTLFSNATDKTTRMTLKYILLSKDATSWMIPSREPCWNGQNYRDRKQASDYQKLAVGQGDGCSRAREVFWDNGPVLYLDDGIGYTTVCICSNSQNCALKGVNFTVSYTTTKMEQTYLKKNFLP